MILINSVIADQVPLVTQRQEIMADFNQPSAVAVDKNEHIFVLDGLNQRIVVFNSEAKLLDEISLTFKGDSLSTPMDMLLTEKSIIVADTANHRLVEFDLKGNFIQLIELALFVAEEKKLPEPVGLWLYDDILYWSDRANHQICKIHLKKYQLIHCFGSYGEASNQFQFPFQMAMDRDGYLHIVDILNGRVQIFNSQGKFFSQLGRFGIRNGELFRPNGIAVDKLDYVFVSDSYLGRISVFKSGRFISYLMDTNHVPLHFETPVYLKLSKNKLLVVDMLKNSVLQFNLSYQLQKNNNTQNKPSTDQTPVVRKMSSGKNCISCHLSWEDDQLFKLLQITDDQVLPVASKKMCYSCHHGAVVESRIAMIEKHQHPDIYSEKKKEKKSETFQDKIPEFFPLSDNGELLCSTCHSPHNSDENQEVLYHDHKNSWLRISNQNGDLCERCHESKGTGARTEDMSMNHPLDIRFLPAPAKSAKNYVQETHLQHGLPEALINNGGMLDKQQQLICQTCHQIHAGKKKNLLTLSDTDSELCISCHKMQYAGGKEKSRQQGIHPVNVKLDKAIKYKGKVIEQVTCTTCHKVHNGQLDTALLWDTAEQNVEVLCTSCHQRHTAETQEEAVKKGIHPVNIKLEKAVKINNKVIKTVTCLSCHSVHQGKKQTASLVQSDKDGQLCNNCHKQEQSVVNSDHDLRLTADKKKNHHNQVPEQSGVCGTCHSMHKGRSEQSQWPFLYAAKIVEKKG